MAAPTSKTRRHVLKPDEKGRYRPRIGVREVQPGQFQEARFNLGTDRKAAEYRYALIQSLYEDEIRAGANCWTLAGLELAQQIARGQTAVAVPPPQPTEIIRGGKRESLLPAEPDDYAQVIELDRQRYPSLTICPSDPAMYKQGVALNASQIAHRMKELREELRTLGMLAADDEFPLYPVEGTLHQALDQYAEYVKTKPGGITDGTMHHRLSQVKRLKQTHEDRPLVQINLSACRELFAYWTKRPAISGEEKRYAGTTCKHRVSELSMFFDWLHTEESFGWRKPGDYDTIEKRIERVGKRRSIRTLVGKPTFTLDHLAAINRQCDTLDRLLLYLGLNCGFGAAESGRLEMDDLFLRQKNPLEHFWLKYGFSSTVEESWIALLRNKTGVAGCWQLWPETVQAIDDWLVERPQCEEQRLIVTERGKPLYRDHSKNAQSGFAKRWKDILDRAEAARESVPRLPFGTLRDQFSDWATFKGFSEEASIGLAHGKPFADNLQECYANRPFPRLFELQRQYREFLNPVFEAGEKTSAG